MYTCTTEIKSDKMTETEMMMIKSWGTWEELLLGGAVLRHGNRAWDAVASELRSRTLYPFYFTAEVCKAKYKDLRKRYRGCKTWFEELRKKRVAELKRELEISEDSIGSLETKIENLKADKVEEHENNIKYDTSRIESPGSNESTQGIGFSGKEISNNSKNEYSAGSFTEETRTNWSPECQIPAKTTTVTVSNQEMDNNIMKPEEEEEEVERENVKNDEGTICGDIRISNLRKRRGKRKRKVCNSSSDSKEVKKETSLGEGESDVQSTVDVVMDGVDCYQIIRSSSERVDPTVVKQEDEAKNLDLMKILNSIMENENLALFRYRLDSQKKARYRKTIRRHIDFNTIRSRINNRSIKSSKELYRDLLLLSNNALIFYPKNTREYITAICIRDLVKKTFRQNGSISVRDSGGDSSVGGGVISSEPPVQPYSLPVKPRSIRPRNRKVLGNFEAEEIISTPNPKRDIKRSDFDVETTVEKLPVAAEVVVVKKNGGGRNGRGGRGNGSLQTGETTSVVKGRKRVRRR